MQQRKYDLILENLEVGYFYIDKDGIIRDVNNAWVKLYKYNSKEEIIGKHFAVIQKIDDLELAEQFVNEIMAGNPDYMNGEFSRLCKDDTIGYHSFSANPVLQKGKITGIEGIIIDCTERKKLQEELRKNKETLEGYLETAAEIVLTLDPQGMITLLNESGHLLLEYDNGSLIGKNWFDSCIPEFRRNDVKKIFKKLMHGEIENTSHYENEVCTKNGQIKTIVWHNTVIKDKDGNLIGTLSSGEDITDLINAKIKAVRSEKFTESLLNAIPTPVFYKDREARYLGCNKAFTEIMGVTSEDIKGKSVFDLWPTEHAKTYHKKDLELIQKPAHQIYEFKIKDKDGKIRPVIYTKDAFYDEDGNIAGLVGAFIDISERKKVENEIKKAEKEWINIFNSISDPTFILSPDQIILDINEAALRAINKTKDEIVGQKCHKLLHGSNSPPEKCPFSRISQTREAAVENMKVEILGGTYMVTTSAVLDEKGELEKVIHHAKDITQIEQLQEELIENEKRLNLTLESTGLGVWDMNFLTGKVIRNETWAEMLGYDLAEVQQNLNFFLDHVHPDDLDRVNQTITKHESGVVDILRVEHRMKHKNGDWIWIKNVGKIIERDKKNRPVRALGFHENIDERKKAEQKIKLSKKKLEILNKIIRHDLANDFNVIKSCVNLFKRKADQNLIDEIDKRVKRSLQTILNYKIYEEFLESNRDLEIIDLKKIFNKLIPLYKDLKFKISGSGKVLADQALVSVLKNLFSNSLKHGKADEIKIKIKSDSEYYNIHIHDNGRGIPDKIKERIFEEGFAYGKTGNTGIGLFIARKTIENYGGEIFLAEDQSQGAAFLIKLKKAY